MKRLCVIGDPVLHSKSPLIQNAMLRALGLDGDYVYSAVPVPRGEVGAWLERCRREGFLGFNATMPHKEALVPFMDVLSQDAADCASVNTVCIRDGKLYGFSTDGEGFVRSLRDAGVEPAVGKAVLLGAGGAAKAVALKLAAAGAGSVVVCNRTAEKAERLCAARPDVLRAASFEPEALRAEAAGADLLVNCTSLGMTGTQGQFSDLSFLDALPARAAVCDLIYSPPETLLLAGAKARGHVTLNGLGMLIHQAICALEYFLDRPLDAKQMQAAVRRVL